LLWALIFGLVLFAGLSGKAHAQALNAKPDKEEIAALREKAFKLLESVAGQLNTLQSAENRARLGANVVDSLWKRDEERARSLLRMVQEDIKTELQRGDLQLTDYRTLSVFLKLRHDTIERLAKHDAQTALDFLKATEPVFEEEAPPDFRSGEQALALRLARQVAADNPDAALRLGREALDRGFSKELILLLARLNRRHKQQGQILYKEIVTKLSDANLLYSWEDRAVAQALIDSFPPPETDETTYRELVGILVTKALAHGCSNKLSEGDPGRGFCQFIASIIRPVEKYDPRASQLRHWTFNTTREPNFGVVVEEMDDLIKTGSFDEAEGVGSKYPELQAMVYLRSINGAIYSGDFERARKLVDRFITDPTRKRELLALIVERNEVKVTISDEKIAQILRRLEEMAHPQARAAYLLAQANAVGNADQKFALNLLAQAGEIIETMKPGRAQTSLRVDLAMLYCLEKNDRGFGIMESLLPKLNELVEFAVKLDGYDTNYLRNGEWNMSGSDGIGGILTQLSQRAGYFAWSDFDRAVSLSSQFERPEIRLMAHLKLAQSILAGPPQLRRTF
jgi:hypothetical protein